jgi:hypothetical protein
MFKALSKLPRMFEWLLLSLVLFFLVQLVEQYFPRSHAAVSLYKLHLLSLAGWGGYVLDRALFPYSRPHVFFHDLEDAQIHGAPHTVFGAQLDAMLDSAVWSMLRRAVIVLGCLVCVGLGA